MHRRLPRRGMTLVELLVTTAVLGIVMVGVLGALMENQRQYVAHADVAGIQGNLRFAATQIEQALLRAGYGIDPNYALEPWALDTTGNEVSGGARDGTGTYGADALVVHYRDPLFRRQVTSVSGSSIGIDRPLLEPIERGQRLLVLCQAGQDGAYVTAAASAAGASTITLLTAGANPPWDDRTLLTGQACFGAPGASVMRVERRHFQIVWFTVPGGTRPGLVVRRGVDLNGNNLIDEAPTATALGDAELVALDVEQLQVAYAMNRPSATLAGTYGITAGPDGDGNFVYADDPTATPPDVPRRANPAWTGAASAPNPPEPPFFTFNPVAPQASVALCASSKFIDDNFCGYGAKRRYTGHPGNVRIVRYSLAARSAREEPQLAATGIDVADGGVMENLRAADLSAQPLTRHRRQRLGGAITLRNMYQRRHVAPFDCGTIQDCG